MRARSYSGAHPRSTQAQEHIAVSGLGARVEVIFEDGAFGLQGGRPQDAFAPLAVHVYT